MSPLIIAAGVRKHRSAAGGTGSGGGGDDFTAPDLTGMVPLSVMPTTGMQVGGNEFNLSALPALGYVESGGAPILQDTSAYDTGLTTDPGGSLRVRTGGYSGYEYLRQRWYGGGNPGVMPTPAFDSTTANGAEGRNFRLAWNDPAVNAGKEGHHVHCHWYQRVTYRNDGAGPWLPQWGMYYKGLEFWYEDDIAPYNSGRAEFGTADAPGEGVGSTTRYGHAMTYVPTSGGDPGLGNLPIQARDPMFPTYDGVWLEYQCVAGNSGSTDIGYGLHPRKRTTAANGVGSITCVSGAATFGTSQYLSGLENGSLAANGTGYPYGYLLVNGTDKYNVSAFNESTDPFHCTLAAQFGAAASFTIDGISSGQTWQIIAAHGIPLLSAPGVPYLTNRGGQARMWCRVAGSSDPFTLILGVKQSLVDVTYPASDGSTAVWCHQAPIDQKMVDVAFKNVGGRAVSWSGVSHTYGARAIDVDIAALRILKAT